MNVVGERVRDVRKVAVLRANALGDLVFSLPALAALRAAYADAEIVLLGRRWHVDFLASRPSPVDRVVVVPRADGIWREPGAHVDERDLARFFEAMVAERFDLAVQLHGGGRHSNPLVARLGARVTVGLRTPDAMALDRCVPYDFYQPEVLRLLEVAAAAGAPPAELEPRLAVTDADLAEADAFTGGAGPLVVLHPGASDGRRRWPTEKFAAVGDALVSAGARVVVTGSGEEAPVVDAVLAAMGAAATPAVDVLSTGGLAGLLSRCAVTVSNDTGPLHVAGAVGAATVGIFWCGNLITAGPLSRTRHRPFVSWRLDCPICGVDCTRGTCEHRESFVADVRVAGVRDAALDLLAAAAPLRRRLSPSP